MRKIITAVAAIALTAMALTGCGSISSAVNGAGGGAGASDMKTAVAWADEKFGTFAPVNQAGAGDTVITLPGGSGIVTATHDGTANFVLNVLDAANTPTSDLLVNTIGAYSGTTLYGVRGFGEPATSLQVTADGNWNITISPVGAAPALTATGVGDGVFTYDGGANTSAVTSDGSANFVVTELSDSLTGIDLFVNEIGPYTGSIPTKAGPGLFIIQSNGNWSITPA
jgi:uncharacterized protein YceK